MQTSAAMHLDDAHALAIGISSYQHAPPLTVAVLTPSYLQGPFEEFQSLLGQHLAIESREPRFLPLLRRDCRPPLGVRMTEALDVGDDPDVDAALQRLALRLREAPHPGLGR